MSTDADRHLDAKTFPWGASGVATVAETGQEGNMVTEHDEGCFRGQGCICGMSADAQWDVEALRRNIARYQMIRITHN